MNAQSVKKNCDFQTNRILEAKNMLANDEFDNQSLKYISEEVGFGSLNTFILVFKESTGITPGRFRQESK